MNKVVLDPRIRAHLHDLSKPLQFIDESGQLLGFFTPHGDAVRLKPQISNEEIQRRIVQGAGRPLADILCDLERGK